MHLAHLRQEALSPSSTENSNAGFVKTDMGGGDGKGGAAKKGSELLTEASISMSLAILETLGPSRECLLPLNNAQDTC